MLWAERSARPLDPSGHMTGFISYGYIHEVYPQAENIICELLSTVTTQSLVPIAQIMPAARFTKPHTTPPRTV